MGINFGIGINIKSGSAPDISLTSMDSRIMAELQGYVSYSWKLPNH